MLVAFAHVTWAAPSTESRAARTMAAWVAPSPGKIFVIAHRADWRNFPENSLAAIRSCISLGVDLVEIDLQKTKDGELIVIHDATLERTTTGQGRVEDLTLGEIRELRLRDGLGQPTAHAVPTLREVLSDCGRHIALNLDKGYRHLDQIIPLLEETEAEANVLLKGPWSVAELTEKHGRLWERFAYMPVVNFDRPNGLGRVRDWLRNARPSAMEIVFSKWSAEVEAAFEECRVAGVRIWVNTLWPHLAGGRCDDLALDDPDGVYGWFIERGVTAFQTDRPRELLAYLARRSGRTQP